MIGLVVVTHGRLAEELIAATEHVVGAQQAVATVCIGANDHSNRQNDVLAAVRSVDSGAGVLILTDMFGGTPSNLAVSVTEETGAEVLTGVNLPMLIKLMKVRNTGISVQAAAIIGRDAGRKYITVASEVLLGEETR
jgi:mannose PTS system EIIA component